MSTAKPFTWIVRFTVAPLWVQDGFSISDERALQMLANTIGFGSADELQAKVLEAPSALQIARMQGYAPEHGGRVVRELLAGVGRTGVVHNALIRARDLLNSVAFVATEGDTSGPLERINEALALIDARQGEAVEVEA